MSNHDKNKGATLSIVEAVETLSNIADLEFDRHIGIAQKHDLIVQDKPLIYHTVHWLHQKDSDATVGVVKETFRVILNYLRNFYKQEYNVIYDPRAIENIKTIMVLVGEAAKKLDKYTALFHEKQGRSVTELEEYKKLQDFYLSRIARKIDEGVLGRWILGLTQKVRAERAIKPGVKLKGKGTNQAKHIFIDLESVKKDTEYELFLLRKEDGTRFFSPRLIRNIKLVSDFGDYFGEEMPEDPLEDMNIWRDRVAYSCSKSLIKAAHAQIEKFYVQLHNFNENELAITFNKSLMALMLAANPHNLSHNLPIKNCCDYFHDFQLFLRRCLHSRDYERMVAYPPEKNNHQAHALLNAIQALCQALYAQVDGLQEVLSWIHGLVQRADKELSAEKQGVNKEEVKSELWSQLARDYTAMTKLMKMHPNGPLNKILEALEDGNYREFDPLMQENVPSQLYTLHTPENKYSFARWPSPTHQEFINKATVTDEFKGLLYACAEGSDINRCLLINLQDRMTWKDHLRCMALEELTNNKELQKHINVVTIAKDTEFYHQLAPYHLENHAEIFMKQFEEQLLDEECGFMFPKEDKKALHDFIKGGMQAVHQLFFSGKNILLREHRMDFIEIFYLFLELKIIELCKPDVVGFTCKDSIDIGAAAGAELFILLKLLNQERMSESDRENLDLMLYAPALLFRERIMLPERFNRLISAMKVIEEVSQQHGHRNFKKVIHEAFGGLYKTPILEGKVVPCHKVVHRAL